MHRFLPFIVLIYFAHTVFYPSCLAEDDSLIADTAAGSIRGRLENVIHGLSVKQFRGIPYSEPPLGELRFARPQPAKPWKGVRDALEFGPECPQISLKEMFEQMKIDDSFEDAPQSEDCLTLNVYTPSKVTAQDKLAVMVWIHGGAFTIGSASIYDPSLLVAHHRVIVVTINYRLGVFGFFNIPGTDVKGNFGMHDQILALKWVQQNIANFGGDPKNVTIFGESAGGMSVSFHLISPLSKDLFQRAIAQSGSSVSPFIGLRVKSTKPLETFAKDLDCDMGEGLVDCVRSRSSSDLLKAQRNVTFPVYMGHQSLCTVTIDDEFLTDDPRTLLTQGKVNRADVMMGVTANEGAFFVMLGPYGNGSDVKDVENMVRHGFGIHPNQNKLIEDATLFEYIDQSDTGNRIKNREIMMDLCGDNMFYAPAVYEAKALSKAEIPVYFYVFDHVPHFSPFPKFTGAFHGVDLVFTFGNAASPDILSNFFKFFGSKYSDMDAGLSHYSMKLWTGFAKHGNPNAGEFTPVVTWPRYNSSGHVHLRISLNPQVEHSFRDRKMAFWNEFVPKLIVKEGEPEPVNEGKETQDEKPVKQEL